MAVTRNKLFDAILNSAAWDAGVVFNRTNAIPIDKFSVFASYDEALAYAENNPIAYPGQIITVVSEGNYATGYIVQEDGSLKILAVSTNTNDYEQQLENLTIEINKIKSKLFVGTKAEYDAAIANNEIALGAIVVITDDEELSDNTSAILGQAILGQMILG